ncbi:hypothetical protein HDV01_004918 [Terramyces sp. JEL0728]|nr:hypothetical protein HDV01_004918 [Terramyces sp. JEL0728]
MSKLYDRERQGPRKRKGYTGSCKCKLICVAIFVVIGLAAYFIMPGVPTVTAGNAYTPANSPGFLINGKDASDYSVTIPATPITSISYDFAINITIYSPSYIDIGFRKINVSAILKDANNKPIPNFWANSTLTDIHFPPRKATVIPVPMKMTMESSGQDSLITNPSFTAFIQQCGPSGSKKMNSTITILFDIGAFSWINFYPSFSINKEIDCPDISQLGSFLSN